MIAARSSNLILAERLWPETSSNGFLRSCALVLAGTLMLALSAHVQVPFWPVKMSMQSFVVLAIAVAYGSRLGTATVITYLLEGAVGLPVFQSGFGPSVLAGPTAGYLAGFTLAAWIVGRLAERGAMRSWLSTFCVLLLGDAVIMGLGVAWLSTLIGIEKAFSAGFLIFLPAEALKIALAAALTRVSVRAGTVR